MATLTPSILSRDPEDILEKIKIVENVPELSEAQIDFADGQFVPNMTVLPSALPKISTRLRLEAHLMVWNPEKYFHALEALGFSTVYIHYESFHSRQILQNALGNAKHMGFRVGLAINPQTDISVLDGFIDEVDEVMLMGVNPGYQGQKFIPETLDRLQSLRKKHDRVIIEVDGGVKADNIASIVAHGANKPNVGSGIWQTPDPKQTIRELLKKIK